uniref:Uncharacterized protein n=1 Tax=Molossus molossus TaxID=27622 RepID=A0A7J8JV57_MOLMO|nr:hypothetical protein HJG59_007793 [Molossus molossus]
MKCLYWAICCKVISQAISIDNIKHSHGHLRPKIALQHNKLEPEEHKAGDLQKKRVIRSQVLRGDSEQTTAMDCLPLTQKVHSVSCTALPFPGQDPSRSFCLQTFQRPGGQAEEFQVTHSASLTITPGSTPSPV